MAVFSKLLVATTLLSSFALAAPWGKHTFTKTEWTTLDVTTTIYIDDATTATSPAATFTGAPAAASTSAASTAVISTPAVAAAPAPSAPSVSTPESVAVPSTDAAPAIVSTPVSSAPAPVMTTLATSTSTTAAPAIDSARAAPSSSPGAATDGSDASVPSSASDSATCEGEGNACQGDITFYAPGLGACGVTNAPTDHIIALPFEFMGTESNDNPYCGRSVMIVNPANGNSVAATVEDKCMGCSGRSIDLTTSLFDILSDNDEAAGRIHGIDWWFTD